MAKSGRGPKARAKRPRPGRFRIIGGTWRSRRLPLPGIDEVRPTPDRVRETVFNWLAPVIEGARCLDLYAGSGALGLEALSRGAAAVTFVDSSPLVVRQLKENLALLGCGQGEVVCMDVTGFLEGPVSRFDVVFLDPPYGRGWLAPMVARLVERGWLAPGAALYLEHEADAGPPPLPEGWRYARDAAAGRVRYHLVRHEATSVEQR